MKLNLLFLSILFIGLSLGVQAQEKGIAFEPDGTTLEQAVAKAKASNKLVFLDCYTSWCGPCKMMSSKVFPQEAVGNFMNPAYVSIKINMEKGYGAELGKKLEVTAYPTFVIFNGNGQEVGRFIGGSQAEEFIKRVKDNSVDKGSAEMDKRFAEGDRDPKFLMTYLNTLGANYKRTQCNVVAEALLEGRETTFANDSTLRMVFMRHINNPFAKSFIHTAKQPEALIAAIGDVPVAMKLRSVWSTYPKTLVTESNGEVSMNKEKFDAYVALMKECGVAERDYYRLDALITYAQKKADWSLYMQYMQEYWDNPSLDITDLELCKRATPIAEKCNDTALRQTMTAMLEQRLADLDSGKREPQTRMGNMILSGNMRNTIEKVIGFLKNGKME